MLEQEDCYGMFRGKTILLLFSTLCSVAYLAYRALYTLNLDGYWTSAFSVAVLIAEIHGVGLMLLYYWQIRDTTPAPRVPPLQGRSVDIFLPTYNEDVPLLRGSLLSYLAFDYPCRIYVLDDGNRPEVRKLAEELGVEYIARGNNLHAKAGNINHALEMTSGEFVVIFDADHVARPHFISRTIGYFADDRVGWVQTPHAFYNFDSFSSIYQPERSRYWEEGDLFYRCIQLGKSNANAVVFCGSAAMMRRAALEDVGLIAVETITEDMHTGLRMHSKGWKSVFVEERLIAAQAANDVTTYQSQRLRWGEGNLSIIRYDNPLTMRGLTLTQRIHYIGSMLGWSSGVGRLVLYATPILMLLTGVAPVGRLTAVYVALLLSHLIVSWTTLKVTGMGAFRIIGNELSGMACFWVQIRAVWRALTRKNSRFVVTKKRGRQTASLMSHIVPQLILLASGLLAIAWSSARVFFGVDQNAFGLMIGIGLIIPQTFLAWTVIRRALCGTDRRFSYRHQQGAVHVVLRDTDSSTPSKVRHGVCCDFNETGAKVLCFESVEPGKSLLVNLEAGHRSVEVQGTVRWASPAVPNDNGPSRSGWHLGIHFESPSEQCLKELWSIGLEHVVADNFERFQAADEESNELLLPVVLKSADDRTLLHSLLYSFEGTSLFVRDCRLIPDKTPVSFEVHSPLGIIRGCGTCETSSSREAVIRISEFTGQGRGQLKVLQELSKHAQASAFVKPVPHAQRRRVRTPLMTTARWVSVTTIAGCAVFFSVFSDHVRLTHLLWIPDSQVDSNAWLAETCQKVRDGRIRDLSRITLLTQVLEASGQKAQLAEMFRLAIALQPENEGLLRGTVNAVAAVDGPAEALRLALNSGLTPERCENETLMTIIRMCAAAETPKKSLPFLNELTQRESLSVTERVELGGHCLAADEPALARACLEGVTEPEDPAALGLIRVMVAVAEKDFETVQRESRDLVTRFPANKELMLSLADCQYWSGDYRAAADIWKRMAAQNSLTSVAQDRFADALLKMDRPEEALQLCLAASGPLTSLRCAVVLESEVAIAGQATSGSSGFKEASHEAAVTEALQFPQPDERLIWAVVRRLKERQPSQLLSYLESHQEALAVNPDLQLELADLYFARQEFERITPLIAELTEGTGSEDLKKSREERVQFLKARSLAGLERYSEAAELLAPLQATRVSDEVLTMELAGLWLSAERTAEALQLSQQISLQDCSSEVATQVVGLQMAARAWSTLPGTLDVLTSRFPDEPEFRFASAEVAFASQDFDGGLKALSTLDDLSLDDAMAARRALMEGCGLIWNGRYPEGLKKLMPLMEVVQENELRLVEDTILLAAIEMESIPKSTSEWGLPVARSLLTLPPEDPRLPIVCAFLMRNGSAEDVVERLRNLAAGKKLPLELRLSLIDALAETARYEAALREIHSVLETEDLDHSTPEQSPYTPVGKPVRSLTTRQSRSGANKKTLATRPRLLLTAARCAANSGKLQESADYFQQLRDEDNLDDATAIEYAGILFQLERKSEAAAILDVADDFSGDNQLLAFDILIANGRTEKAAAILSALETEGARAEIPNRKIQERIARLAIVRRDYLTAAAVFDDLAQQSPEEIDYIRQAAGSYLLGENHQKSLVCFGRLLEAGQLTPDDTNGLMSAISQSELPPPWALQWAEDVEARALRGEAVTAEVIEQLVYLRQNQKNVRSAYHLLNHLLQMPGRATPRLRFMMANIAAECGDYEESERQLELLRRPGPSSGSNDSDHEAVFPDQSSQRLRQSRR